MNRTTLLLATLLTSAAPSAISLAAPPASDATVKAHLDAAAEAASSDLKSLIHLCDPAPATRPKGDDHALEALIDKPAPPPAKAFDRLYFVGDAWVSAWALDTSDGIILIDTLNSGKEAAKLIEGGLRQVGLDPARIKYIIVTHGHGDHYGGANYLVERYHPRVVMSDADWTMMETKLEFETPLWDAPPKRDIVAKDGDTVTLGDTSVTLYLTPGHTMGTISPVFDVTWRGEKHRVLEWGGTGFNFGADFGRLDAYITSTKRLRDLVGQQHIDVLISNHSGVDEAPAKLARLRDPQTSADPFVLGTPTVQRALTVMGECAQAQRDRFTLQGLK
ncbi:metallo-beta-lactamase class B [Enhydrobacter aerosaccus]|uniref:Metallo-beta-lactamase class B n=1 Tax=Enhydrobacter aerosaccus TaxID=225324 RepID=A0A1T4TEM4_9HYPH|nr:MBL fold metallo-hydrolase [Enhydrobacter aerosaccus]SKA38907.1 metallo-beta-lactamase class B [Enhydrobacter aerosaccus]